MGAPLRTWLWPVAPAVLALAGIYLVRHIAHVRAQTSCVNPPLTGLGGWTAGSGVTYRISSNADSSEVTQLNQAFASWTSANSSNGSGISFTNLGSQQGPPQISVTLCNTAGCAGGNPSEVSVSPQSGNPVTGANITIDTTKVPDGNNDVLRSALHEIGHTMGLDEEPGQNGQPNCGQVPGGSVMNSECGTSFDNIATSVTACDQHSVSNEAQYAPLPPEACTQDSDCSTGQICYRGTCKDSTLPGGGGGPGLDGCSPIIMAIGSTPDYDLTSVQGGVWFDVTGTGVKQLVAWTQAGSAGWFSRFGS